MIRYLSALFAIALVLTATAPTLSSAKETAAPTTHRAMTAKERLRDLIWAKELKNYAGRATTAGLARYIASTSPDYMVWPPGRPAPLRLADLRASNAGAPKGDQEKLALTLIDFTAHDGTAIIYYSTHKTMTAIGEVVDERYDTIHVWSRYGRQWKLTGGLARRTL